MYELLTPKEIILKMVLVIENERKRQNFKQTQLALKANIPYSTYKEFIYKHKISFINLIKILIALRLFENISSLLSDRKKQTLQDIENEEILPKRIVK